MANDNDAWLRFFEEYSTLIRQVFCRQRTAITYSEFRGWFPGWLYTHGKLHSLYRALIKQMDLGKCKDTQAQELYVRNYLVRVVKSAIVDDYRKQQMRVPNTPPQPQRLPPELEHAEPVNRIREELLSLEAELRVPFWIRHFRALGPLAEPDTKWVAGLAGCSHEAVNTILRNKADKQSDPDRPLSARFIGDWLGLPPDSNCDYSAVYQRLARAKERIRDRLKSFF